MATPGIRRPRPNFDQVPVLSFFHHQQDRRLRCRESGNAGNPGLLGRILVAGAVRWSDAGKGDAGKCDAGKGDAGKGDAWKGDAGKGDAGKGDAGNPVRPGRILVAGAVRWSELSPAEKARGSQACGGHSVAGPGGPRCVNARDGPP